MKGRTPTKPKPSEATEGISRGMWLAAAGSPLLLWLAQPPLGSWPIALIALLPWLSLTNTQRPLTRRDYRTLWLGSWLYWAITLEGLRHAHPAIYFFWLLLTAYLAVYPVLMIGLCRHAQQRGLPLWITAPLVWVGGECVRTYLFTGISVTMLGHAMADVPTMIQIADLFGSYGVSFVVVCVNVAVYSLVVGIKDRRPLAAVPSVMLALVLVVATIMYGITV